MQNSQRKQNAYGRLQFCDILACEQVLWSGKELRKGRERAKRQGRGAPSSSTVYARLAPLADFFLGVFPIVEPVNSFAISLLIQQRIAHCFIAASPRVTLTNNLFH